jgi:predicted cupin superfamily sugar epimerase
MEQRLSDIIQRLALKPHPEGGFYKETYRSEGVIGEAVLGTSYSGDRNFSTAIYFLLTSSNFSAFHRILQDEAWHYYDGHTLHLHLISPDGVYTLIRIGKDIVNGEIPQFVVPGGYWFAAEVPGEEAWTLLGCTVSPGFDFRDFELTPRSTLLEHFPQHLQLIERLTRVD